MRAIRSGLDDAVAGHCGATDPPAGGPTVNDKKTVIGDVQAAAPSIVTAESVADFRAWFKKQSPRTTAGTVTLYCQAASDGPAKMHNCTGANLRGTVAPVCGIVKPTWIMHVRTA